MGLAACVSVLLRGSDEGGRSPFHPGTPSLQTLLDGDVSQL